jgi:hypothetical protein
MVAEFAAVAVRDGRAGLEFRPHIGQYRALSSRARFVLVLAGTQSGKTVTGPLWLLHEIKARGPGDYMVVTPTYPLLGMKALPEFLRLFQAGLGLGDYTGSPPRRFIVSPRGETMLFGAPQPTPTVIYFGHAGEPESLESATIKGLWADEAGQKGFKFASWEALRRRMSIHRARALITTTPYDLGWLKQQLYDRWRDGDRTIEVISFDSIANPTFPREEFEERRASMPAWRFNMFYRGRFERPAGLIYDSFDQRRHTCPRFAVPFEWPRSLGLDFGGVNTAALFYAAERARLDDGSWGAETGRLFLYREYLAGGRTAKAHADKLLVGEPGVPTCVGGSKSEGQWRAEFRQAGLPVRSPIVREVEIGINRVYGAHARGEIIVFDDLAHYLDQKATYSRELDELGEPTEAIADKETFHLMDAERYVVGWLMGLRERQVV